MCVWDCAVRIGSGQPKALKQWRVIEDYEQFSVVMIRYWQSQNCSDEERAWSAGECAMGEGRGLEESRMCNVMRRAGQVKGNVVEDASVWERVRVLCVEERREEREEYKVEVTSFKCSAHTHSPHASI